MATTKNLCAQIPIALHERVSEERERLGQTTSEYIANLIQDYQQFRQRAGKQKILFSAIRDSDNKGKVVDVIMPVTEIDRANMIFERIRYTGQPEQARQDAPSKEQEARVGQEAPQREQQRPRQGETPVTPPVGKRQEVAPKKESRLGTDLPDTKGRSTSSSGRETAAGTMTNERTSVLERLKGYQAQLDRIISLGICEITCKCCC